MATMYDSGYGGDKGASYGGYDPMEEERRRRREQQQGAQQQNPYQQQNEQAAGAFRQGQSFQPQQPQAQPQMQQMQQMQQAFNQARPQQQPQQQDQRTFAQRQQAGEARPAPPQAQPTQQAQNQQMQQAFNQAQPVQMMPGGPMPVSQFGGQPMQQMQQMQQMGPPGGQQQIAEQYQQRMASFTPQQQQLSAQMGQQAQSMGLDPMAAMMDPEGFQRQLAQMGGAPQSGTFAPNMMNSMGDTLPPAGPQGFTGDIGAYLGGQLNSVGQGLTNLPNAYIPDAELGTRVAGLAGAGLPATPTFTPDDQLMAQARQLTTNRQLGGGAPAAPNMPAGVSATGLDPVSAMAGGAAGGAPSAPSSAPSNAAAGGQRGSYESLLQEAYNNPSAFDNAAVQQLYDRMGQDIDDRFAQEQRSLQNDMAARGLSDSSIMGGRMADLNVGRRSARTELANQLGIQRAQDFANQRNAVLGLGQNQQSQNLQAELGRGNLGLAGQRLGLEAQGQQFGQQMQGLQFQNLLGQQNFANQLASGDFGLRRAGQAFNQGLQGAQFQNALGQQGFQNRMSLADMERARSNDLFGQRMGITDRLTGYGQQAFDNDLRSADFNARLQDSQWRRYLDSIALGG